MVSVMLQLGGPNIGSANESVLRKELQNMNVVLAEVGALQAARSDIVLDSSRCVSNGILSPQFVGSLLKYYLNHSQDCLPRVDKDLRNFILELAGLLGPMFVLKNFKQHYKDSREHWSILYEILTSFEIASFQPGLAIAWLKEILADIKSRPNSNMLQSIMMKRFNAMDLRLSTIPREIDATLSSVHPSRCIKGVTASYPTGPYSTGGYSTGGPQAVNLQGGGQHGQGGGQHGQVLEHHGSMSGIASGVPSGMARRSLYEVSPQPITTGPGGGPSGVLPGSVVPGGGPEVLEVSRQVLNDLVSGEWRLRRTALAKLKELIQDHEYAPSGKHLEVATALSKALKHDAQRHVLAALMELVAEFPLCLSYSQVLLDSAKVLVPLLLPRINDKIPQVAHTAVQGCEIWLSRIGVLNFSYYGIFGCTQKPLVTRLTADKKEILYSLMAECLRHQGLDKYLPMEGDHALPFLELLCSDAANERSQPLVKVCCNIIAEFDLSAGEWECLLTAVESVGCLSAVQDAILQKLNDGSAAELALLPCLENESMSKRLSARNGRWSPTSWTSIEDIRKFANEWKPHVTDNLWYSMFPELSSADFQTTHALEFWSFAVEFGSKCTCVEDRLGATDNFVRIFDEHGGIFDLLCQWLLWRVTDPSCLVRATAARILQESMARLIAARVDVRFLQENGFELTTSILLEGTLDFGLTEKLLDAFLELLPLRAAPSSADEDEVYATLKDVFYALTFVARDVCRLYALTMVKYKRHPEVLELTRFIIEQEGWHACSNLFGELTEFAQNALSEQQNTVTELAAHCMVLILLSLTRRAASTALNKLEEQIPGCRKFVSRYTRAHQELLSVFPRGGVGGDENCFEEKNVDAAVYLSRGAENGVEGERVGSQDDAPSATRGEKNALQELDAVVAEIGLDQSIQAAKAEIEQKTWLLKQHHTQIKLLDWYYELQREREGKQVGVESELAYWNGVRLLEYAQSNVDNSYIVLECKRLLQQDMSQISEAAQVLLTIHAQNSKDTEGRSEWMLPFSMDLICGCYNALRNVFQIDKMAMPSFIKTAQCVADLTFEVSKDRKVLHQASPGLLCEMFGSVLSCMGCHHHWDELPGSQVLVEKLNAIMGSHLLGLVSPRTASCIVECLYDCAIPTSHIMNQVGSSDVANKRSIDADLFVRVSKRFIRKLNMKHPQVTELDRDNLYPLSCTDRLNYLRTIDSVISCLLMVEICLSTPTDYMSLRKALLNCIRETFASLLIYTPALVGIYLRDKNFSSCFEEVTIKVKNSNSPYKDFSAVALMLDPSMSRTKFASYALERIMNESTSVRPNSDTNYMLLHKAYLASGQNSKLTLPDELPVFSINEIVHKAPSNISLTTLDSTTAGGWTKKRDQLYVGEEAKKRSDVVPLEELKVRSDAEISKLGDKLVLQLYRETIGRRSMGRLIHRHEQNFGGIPCLIAHNCLRPERAIIYLHGFANSPFHAIPLIERYYGLNMDQGETANADVWIIPRGPICVGGVNEEECIYSRAPSVSNRRLPDSGMMDGNLYCWWELSSLRTKGTFRQLVDVVKTKLFTPMDLAGVLADIAAVIDSTALLYGLSIRQIYVAGFSQGATLASEVLIHRPDLAGAILLSGGSAARTTRHNSRRTHPPSSTCNDERLWQNTTSTTLVSTPRTNTFTSTPTTLTGSNIGGAPSPRARTGSFSTSGTPGLETPVFVSHGTKDNVIPLTLGKLLRHRLSNKGFCNVEFFTFSGGHEVTDEVLQRLARWMNFDRNPAQSDGRLLAKIHNLGQPVRAARCKNTEGVTGSKSYVPAPCLTPEPLN
ncbi:esterase, partial [Gregarina niphandrodes]